MTTARPLTRSELESFPLPAVKEGDKDSKGRILIVAGSRQTPGAALLAALAAMRCGAGKLQIAAVDPIAVPVAIAMPEAMVIPMQEARDGGFTRSAVRSLKDQARHSDVVVAGPGLANSKSCEALAEVLLDAAPQLVLDAALLHSLEPLDPHHHREQLPVLLPHAGELSSLIDCSEEEIALDPVGCGLKAARLYQANVLVKGVVSHVVAPDGRVWIYEGGVAGLGVSGSGDVLAGIVGGLSARGGDPLTALLWGVLLHGEAGQALSRKVGPVGFLAREIPDEVPALLAL